MRLRLHMIEFIVKGELSMDKISTVRFTEKQIDFIEIYLEELANEYAHVPYVVKTVEEIEETIKKGRIACIK